MTLGRITTGLFALALASTLTACGGSAPAGNAADGNVTAAAAENPREAKFKAIGKANKAIGEELKKDAPSLDAIKPNAAKLAELSPQLVSWFPAGSGKESGIKTEALPAIWAEPDAFKQKAGDFDAAVKALNTAVASGDVAAIKAAAAKVGPTCKACHEKFREKK